MVFFLGKSLLGYLNILDEQTSGNRYGQSMTIHASLKKKTFNNRFTRVFYFTSISPNLTGHSCYTTSNRKALFYAMIPCEKQRERAFCFDLRQLS